MPVASGCPIRTSTIDPSQTAITITRALQAAERPYPKEKVKMQIEKCKLKSKNEKTVATSGTFDPLRLSFGVFLFHSALCRGKSKCKSQN